MRVRLFILTVALAVFALFALGACSGDKSESSTPSPDSTGTPSSELSPTPSPTASPELSPTASSSPAPSSELTPLPSPEVIAQPTPEVIEGIPSIPGCAVAGLVSDLDFGGQLHFAPGEPISITLTLTNCAENDVNLFYPDSQRYEFIVKDEEGAEVWRWSKDKEFTQEPGEESVKSGEVLILTEVWDQRDQDGQLVPLGLYQILGLSVGCADSSISDCQFGLGLFIGIES